MHYLTLLDKTDNTVKNKSIEPLLVTIKLYIEAGNIQNARTLIDENHKLIGHDPRLLTLDINLQIAEKHFIAAAQSLVTARKQKNITEQQIEQWEDVVFYGAFKQLATDENIEEVSRYWNNLSNKLKKREVIILAYCKVLAEHKITDALSKILLPVIKKGANQAFIKQIRSLPISSPDELIAVTQKHLQKDAQNPMWLSCLAHLAVSSQQWEVAEKAFNSLISLDDNLNNNADEKPYDKVDLLAFATTLKERQQYEQAVQAFAKLHELT